MFLSLFPEIETVCPEIHLQLLVFFPYLTLLCVSDYSSLLKKADLLMHIGHVIGKPCKRIKDSFKILLQVLADLA